MLELKNICYTVSTPETGEQTILKDISVTIPDGKLIVFTGPNGGGKTTLAKVIISHQERIIQLADEIIVVGGGEIRHRGTTEEVFPLIMADTLGSCPVLNR